MALVDTRTLLLVLSVGNVLLALLRLGFVQHDDTARWSRIWAAAKFLQGTSFLLFALRGIASDILTMPVADTLLFVGFVAEFVAAQRYLALGARWNAVIAAVALLLAGLWIGVANGLGNDGRQTLVASVGIIVFGSTSAAFATRWRQSTALGRMFGSSYLLIAAIGAMRIAVIARGHGDALQGATIYALLTLAALFLFMVLNGFGFLMLAQEDVGRRLRQSEDRLMLARRMARIANTEVDLATGTPIWSRGVAEVLGFLPGTEPHGWPAYRALIHPDDLARIDSVAARARSGEPLTPDEHRIKGGDGQWRWVRREAALLPGGDTIMITLQDVTERVRMEESLRVGYANLLRAQRLGRIGSAEIDLTTMAVTWSDQLYEIYGRDRAAGPADLGQFFAYIHPEDRGVIASIREQYLRGNAAGAHEFRIVREDGTIRWLHRETEQIMDGKGRPIRLVTVEQDVTERVRMENELRVSRDRLIQAQRIGRMGSGEFDLATGTMLRSDEYHRLLGLDPRRGPYPPDAIVAAIHPDDQETVRAIIARMAAGEDNAPTDLRALHPDGKVVWLRRHQEFVRDGDGRKTMAIVTLQDITALKEVDQAKDEFVSTVSHELRTPLTSIRGALALAAASATGEVSDKVRHLIEVAHRNSDRLARLVDDILDVQRIGAGRMIYHMAEVSITPLIEDAIEANRPIGAKAGVEIRLVAPLPGAQVRADAERLMQVMANLLSNAIKFSTSGQIVEVSIERVAPWVRITVADHGEGIPETYRDKIFTPFSQADGSNSRRRGGSGLGLSIAHAIVAYHGGQLTYDSAVGVGTRFHVDLVESTEATHQMAAD